MSEGVIVALIGVASGAALAGISAWRASRKLPSRLTTDFISLLDANGQVQSNLTEEIVRLNAVADEALEEATEARKDAKQARREAAEANREAIACQGRIHQLERLLVSSGIDVPPP